MKSKISSVVIKCVLYLFSKIRFYPLLLLVRMMPESRTKKVLIRLYSPNTLRKISRGIFSTNNKKLRDMQLDLVYELDINDEIGYQFFFNGTWEPAVLEVARTMKLQKNDIYLDIGANYGLTCIPIAKKLGCEVIAIEASSRASAYLLRNAYLNNIKLDFYNRCVVNKTLFKKKPYIELYLQNGNYGASSIFPNWNKSKTAIPCELVRTTTISTILDLSQQKKIKLIKLDIEGSELLILKELPQILIPNVVIICEFKKNYMNQINYKYTSNLIGLLSKQRSIFKVSYSSKNILELHKFNPSQNADLIISVPKIYLTFFQKNIVD